MDQDAWGAAFEHFSDAFRGLEVIKNFQDSRRECLEKGMISIDRLKEIIEDPTTSVLKSS